MTSHLDLNGTASASTSPDGEVTILHLDLGAGTMTVKSRGGTATQPNTGGVADLPLEVGSFCQ